MLRLTENRRAARSVLRGIVTLAVAWAAPACACSVPVFRYALERWPPDDYQAVVFHRGTLAQADQAIADSLKGSTSARANLSIRAVNVNQEVSEELRALWETQSKATAPWLVVQCPRTRGTGDVMWAGRLAAVTAKALLDSPVRQEIARGILGGECAVWVLLEGEDRRRNDAATALLKAQLKEMERTLELPDLGDAAPGPIARMDTNKDGASPSGSSDKGPLGRAELRVAFSLVRVSRDDPAERMLVNMLLRSEDDLNTCDGPMAFPVFGRGRVLYALVDRGITPENIKEACAFLVGACSCQAKAENPGVDLLITADWGSAVQGLAMTYSEPPPLVGFPGLKEPETRPAVAVQRRQRPPPRSGHLIRSVTIALVAGAAVVGLACVSILKREGGSR